MTVFPPPRSQFRPAQAGCGGRIMLIRELEADMPTARCEIDRDVVQCASQRPFVAVSHPIDLGQTDLGPIGIQLARVDFTALKAERVIDTALSESGVFCDAIEEVGNCQGRANLVAAE